MKKGSLLSFQDRTYNLGFMFAIQEVNQVQLARKI